MHSYQPQRIAYLGPAGTFTEQAAQTLVGAADAELLPQLSVPGAIDEVRQGKADCAVVPLENSVAGSVIATLDELTHGGPLVIVEEIFIPVRFSLLTKAGMSLVDIKTVAVHSHAEAQCQRFLRANLPTARFDLAASNAAAAQSVAQGEYDAAVSGPLNATRFDLTEIAADIGDNASAVTRFVVLAHPTTPPPRTGNDKTSIVAFIRDDHTGALLEVLTELAMRSINLTRIESRPTKEELGKYCFSIDCEGHILDARVGEALSALRRICADVRFLGSYPRRDGEPKAIRKGASDQDFSAAAAWLKQLRQGTV